MSANHAERRPPSEPDQPLDLEEAGDQLLQEAHAMSSGRAARTLTPGRHARLKQTLVALREGVALSEHHANGPATIHLLRGRATVHAGGVTIDVLGGEWTTVPDERHDLEASEDTVALITVGAVGAGQPAAD